MIQNESPSDLYYRSCHQLGEAIVFNPEKTSVKKEIESPNPSLAKCSISPPQKKQMITKDQKNQSYVLLVIKSFLPLEGIELWNGPSVTTVINGGMLNVRVSKLKTV